VRESIEIGGRRFNSIAVVEEVKVKCLMPKEREGVAFAVNGTRVLGIRPPPTMGREVVPGYTSRPHWKEGGKGRRRAIAKRTAGVEA
jgi:hypothetical protein